MTPCPTPSIPRVRCWRRSAHVACAALMLALFGCGDQTSQPPAPPKPPGAEVITLQKSAIQGLQVWSPDGARYLINQEDSVGVAQIYIGSVGVDGLTCLTNVQRSGGPKPERFKMQPHWHPSGDWIFLAVERDEYTVPFPFAGNRDFIEGELQCGLWTNLWAMSIDGLQWRRLTDFRSGVPGTADGFTGAAISPDGTKAVWSQVMDGNIFAYYPFGRWELMLADLAIVGGVPVLSNQRDITPAKMSWNEPGNFHPDNRSLLLTGSVEADAQGMDQYILDVVSGQLTNLTNSPTVWDEHGLFSRDGSRIIFMSAYPYRSDPNSSKVLTVRTEFMLMNGDGSGLTQLTHFLVPAYPESSPSHGMAACPEWRPDGRSANLSRLNFPNYEYWDVLFSTAPATATAASAPAAPAGNG